MIGITEEYMGNTRGRFSCIKSIKPAWHKGLEGNSICFQEKTYDLFPL